MTPVVQEKKYAEGVLKEFYGLCAIPHPSGKEERLGQYLMELLEQRGFCPQMDSRGNILCDIPATGGLEGRPRLMMQAHMDMVCVGAEDYCPETDPIRTEIRDGWLCTDGRSSLGADCGIGLAAALYVTGGAFAHGPIRLIFTVDEERGLRGAEALSERWVQDCGGIINLDSFHFGQVFISSAGGLRQTFQKQTECFFPMLDWPVRISLHGLLGGHSGDDIGKNRGNAGRILVWFLQSLDFPYELATLSAGSTHNAIPGGGYAEIVVDRRDEEKLWQQTTLFAEGIRELYPEEKAFSLELQDGEMPQWVMTVDQRDDFLALGGLILCSVQEMHPLCPQVVGTSNSMGMLFGNSDHIEIRSFPRSYSQEAMEALGQFHTMAAEGLGFTAENIGYPAWPGVSQDPLSDLFLEQGGKLGYPMEKQAVHVGLESAWLHKLAPQTPIVTVGMEIRDPHAVSERVEVESIEKFVCLLTRVLEHFGE